MIGFYCRIILPNELLKRTMQLNWKLEMLRQKIMHAVDTYESNMLFMSSCILVKSMAAEEA
uniref:Uncharacterized protein n=1 Tax=Onchocerca volvulus TaxID=6282 RepID=A0A8R1TUT3_ONCVO